MNQLTPQPQQIINGGMIATPLPSMFGNDRFYEEVSWDDIGNIESDSFDLVPVYKDQKAFIEKFFANPLEVQEEAFKRGMSMETYTNVLFPTGLATNGYRDSVSLFNRLALMCGVFFTSNPRAGYWASTVEEFTGTAQNPNLPGKVLLKAFIDSVHRFVMYYEPKALRERFDDAGQTIRSDDAIPGSYDLPWADAAMVRYSQILEMQIPLALLTSRSENIRGGDYRELEVEVNREERSKPVDQGDEFPVRKLKLREDYTRLHKRGCAVQITDESKRRSRVDRVIEELMVTMINDKIAMVYEAGAVIRFGDENDDTEAVMYDPAELDPDGDFENSDEPTFAMWRNWKGHVKFEAPYRIDLIFASMDRNTQMVKLPLPSTGEAVHLSQDYAMNPNIDNFMPMPADAQNVYYIDVDTALIAAGTKGKEDYQQMGDDELVSMNRMFGGITFLSEIGGTYTEQERDALSQSDLIISSMVYGMAKRQKGKCASYVSYDRADYA